MCDEMGTDGGLRMQLQTEMNRAEGAPDALIERLPDGRLVGYAEYGDPSGLPIFGFHGTPGSRLMFRLADEPARELGVRLIAPERPGFGLSTYQPGRTLASYAADVAALADRLDIARFAVAGVSGGGPYAAACAALLPSRVTALGLVSPVGPMIGDEGAAQIGVGHHVMFRLTPRIPPLLWPIFTLGRAAFLYAPLGIYSFLLSRCAPSDWKILTRTEVRRNLLRGVAEGMRPGVKGGLQEMKLFSRPWRIPFSAIRAPSILWQGTADRNVPPSAAFKLGALIPGCEVNRIEGAGHYWVFDNVSLVLERLIASARREETGGGPLETLH
jgi:pimeloyl-ACP methyl ester carboxylesterase